MLQRNNRYVIVSNTTLTSTLDKGKIDQIISILSEDQNKVPLREVLLTVDLEAVCGLKHLEACIHYALKAFEQKSNTAKHLGPEILLYLAGRRQINKAIKNVGLSKNTSKLLMIEIIEKSDNETIEKYCFQKMLDILNIKYKDFASNIEHFKISNFDKIKKNLEITEDMINLFIKDKSEESYKKAIQKLAIERSAILNLQK